MAGSITWLGKITAGGSSSSVEFTSISQSYNHLIIVGAYRGDSTSSSIINNYDMEWTAAGIVTGNNYGSTIWGNYGTIGTDPTADNKWQVYGDRWIGTLRCARSYNSAANMMSIHMEIFNYASTSSDEKKWTRTLIGTIQTGSDDQLVKRISDVAIDDAAFDSFKFQLPDASNFVSGSYWNLYGVAAS